MLYLIVILLLLRGLFRPRWFGWPFMGWRFRRRPPMFGMWRRGPWL